MQPLSRRIGALLGRVALAIACVASPAARADAQTAGPSVYYVTDRVSRADDPLAPNFGENLSATSVLRGGAVRNVNGTDAVRFIDGDVLSEVLAALGPGSRPVIFVHDYNVSAEIARGAAAVRSDDAAPLILFDWPTSASRKLPGLSHPFQMFAPYAHDFDIATLAAEDFAGLLCRLHDAHVVANIEADGLGVRVAAFGLAAAALRCHDARQLAGEVVFTRADVSTIEFRWLWPSFRDDVTRTTVYAVNLERKIMGGRPMILMERLWVNALDSLPSSNDAVDALNFIDSTGAGAQVYAADKRAALRGVPAAKRKLLRGVHGGTWRLGPAT